MQQMCPNYPEHSNVEVAYHDEEFGYTHYHCATDFGNGVICHAEWDVSDVEREQTSISLDNAVRALGIDPASIMPVDPEEFRSWQKPGSGREQT